MVLQEGASSKKTKDQHEHVREAVEPQEQQDREQPHEPTGHS